MENITVGKWGGGYSTNGHMTIGKERGDGPEGEGEEGGGWLWATQPSFFYFLGDYFNVIP